MFRLVAANAKSNQTKNNKLEWEEGTRRTKKRSLIGEVGKVKLVSTKKIISNIENIPIRARFHAHRSWCQRVRSATALLGKRRNNTTHIQSLV